MISNTVTILLNPSISLQVDGYLHFNYGHILYSSEMADIKGPKYPLGNTYESNTC